MGKRIKDITISEQTKFEPKLRLLVDKMDADVGFPWMQAKNIQLKYLGNAYFQGSTNNSTWHDAIAAGDSFIRFSTDGGTTVKPLNTDTVREGPTNLYFTEARVIQTTGVADAVTAAHVHTNFTLLNNLISNGDGNSFLSNNGTYFNVLGGLTENVIPVKGALGFTNSSIFKDGSSIKIGDAVNNTEFEADGTIKFNGTATVWKDLNFTVIHSGGPSITIPDDVTINNVYHKEFTSSNNQSCGDNSEIPHDAKIGGVFYPNADIFLKAGESAGTTGVTFTLYWELRQTSGTTTGNVTMSATSAELAANAHKVEISGATITGYSELGAELSLALYRTAGDAGDVVVINYGVHYEADTIGGRTLETK